MRFIGLDVHRDFCEVAIADEDGIRSAGRVETTPGSLELFAESLAPDDQVALEATGNAPAIAAILRPHVSRVALANPAAVRGELNAPKTDKVDARALARLLATGFLPEVWAPDHETVALRHQLARRRQLVKQRTREKNQVHAVLQRNLKGKPPASDLFGAEGRGWLAGQELPEHEREMVEASLRHLDFLDPEVAALDRRVAERVLASPEMQRLMQLPGLGPTTAATFMAAVGDVSRFPSPRHLVGYLGRWERSHPRGPRPASRAARRDARGSAPCRRRCLRTPSRRRPRRRWRASRAARK
jgi:transposase